MESVAISAPPQYEEAEARRKHAARSRVLGLSVRVFGDLVIGIWSLLAAFWLRLHVSLPGTIDLLPEDQLVHLMTAVVLVALTQNLSLYLFGFYDSTEPLPRSRLLQRIFVAASLQGLALGFLFFVGYASFPRSILAVFVPLNIIFLFVFRDGYQRVFKAPMRRLAIVGSADSLRELANSIRHHHWFGFEVAGFVVPPGEVESETVADKTGYELLGSTDDIPGLFSAGAIDCVLLAQNVVDWRTRLIDQLVLNDTRGAVYLLPSPVESLIGRARFQPIHDLGLVEVVGEREWNVSDPVKRALDFSVASILLVLTSPLMLGCAVAVRLSSPGPIFFRQTRVSQGGMRFSLIKFRTMVEDAESQTGEVLASRSDPRVTRVGRVLRSLRLDELPQLVNVIRGDMSLVGPRPERPAFVERFLDQIPGYAERFSVKPGLTGLAQVNGDYYTTAENKLRYDLAYIANRSILLDLTLLFQTVKIVLSRPGS